MYNHQIYQLRNAELEPSVAHKVWPFVNAYRPHDCVYSWRELKADGLERIEEDSAMDELNEYYYETHGYYPEDKAILNTSG